MGRNQQTTELRVSIIFIPVNPETIYDVGTILSYDYSCVEDPFYVALTARNRLFLLVRFR